VTPDGKYVVSGSGGQDGAVVGAGDGERSAAVHGARGIGSERRGDARWQIRRFGKRADKTVRVWELATGKEVRRFTGHEIGSVASR
jgi:WD40 repeat protein